MDEATFRVGAEQRMAKATTDEALSDICRDIEARLDAEGAPVAVREAFEALRVAHIRRMYAGARAG